MAKVLVVDDEETLRKLLRSTLERKGHEVKTAEDGLKACTVLQEFNPDVIISDIKMPKLNGFQMLERMKSENDRVPPVIFVTGHGEKAAAIDSLRGGACDYLEKPFENADILHSVDIAVAKNKLELENIRLQSELQEANHKLEGQVEAKTELVRRIQKEPKISEANAFNDIEVLGNSQAMTTVRATIERLSKSGLGAEMSVLVTGESGSGKEVVARLLHELSPRAQGPWVPVNCGAFPENLIESELFGHEKGAFTGAVGRKAGVFEMADGGTLFLDEIGELPLHMQAKLLRALQERRFRRVGGSEEISVNIRIIAATNRDLKEAVGKKEFREDLYYRLNSITIAIPPLRARENDVLKLADKFLHSATDGLQNVPEGFDTDARQVLTSYEWPGNVRELKSVIQRAALMSEGHLIGSDALESALGHRSTSDGYAGGESAGFQKSRFAENSNVTELRGIPYHQWKRDMVNRMETDYLTQLLEQFQGNVSAMSRAMQITRPNLCRLLKKHNIVAEEFRNGKAEAGDSSAA